MLDIVEWGNMKSNPIGFEILGFGKSEMDNVVTNHDLAKFVDTSDEWITSRTGIKQRNLSNKNTSDLAYEAALNAISDAKIDVSEIDLIICATFTPDRITPSVANMVQKKLGIPSANTFDLNAACSGFVYSLNVALGLYQVNNYRKALIIGSEHISKILDFNDRTTCVLFGDGAGAIVVSRTTQSELNYVYSKTIPDDEDILFAGGTCIKTPFSSKEEDLNHGLIMKGQNVFKFAVNAVTEAIQTVLKEEGLDVSEIDYIVPHQANLRILEFVSKQLKIDYNKFYFNIDKYGNTSAASIPIALAEMNELGLLQEPKKIILVGFGGGLTAGACYINYKGKK